MAESEVTTSGTTVEHTETSAEYDKGQTRTSSRRGGCGNRGKSRNNTRASSASTIRYYKGEIEEFGSVIVLKYQKIELKKYFDVFREKLINYTIKKLKDAKEVLVLV